MVLGDILKRWQLLVGDSNAQFLTGTDEHGIKIQQAAEAAGMDTQAFCDMNCQTFKDLAKAANLSHAVHMPTSPAYPVLVLGGWSTIVQLQPWCFVQPSTPAEVAQTIIALKNAGGGAGDWHVAIRSGGHGGSGQNAITNGVTIGQTANSSSAW